MTPVRLEPAALRSRVKHSTTEPLRSLEACSETIETIIILSKRLNSIKYKGCTTIRRKTLRRLRQLVYKDNWSTSTLCRIQHIVYYFFYLRHLVEKICLSIIAVNFTLCVHCDVIFGGVLDYGRNYGTMFNWAAGKYC